MLMHMRGQSQRRFAVNLENVDRYQFVSQAYEDDRLHGNPFRSDEPDPVGDAGGPSTPALLAAALGHCLSASLLEALRHTDVAVLGCATEAVAVVAPNEERLPRIKHVDVTIRPRISALTDRAQRCEPRFERHCTVTSSVREGINVRVQVEWEVEAPQAHALTEEPASS